MAAADEERMKRKTRGTTGMNEMGWALVAAFLIVFLLLGVHRHVNSRRNAAPQSVYTKPPAFSRTHTLDKAGGSRADWGAMADVPVDPPTAPPVSGPQPFPRGAGMQPPTPNPHLTNLFPPSYNATLAPYAEARRALKAVLTLKYGTFMSKEDKTASHGWHHLGTKANLVKTMTEADRHAVGGKYGDTRWAEVPLMEEDGQTHKWDNISNWDVARIELCEQQKKELAAKLPPPPGLMQFIDLVGLEAGTVEVPSGPGSGELPFTPSVVRDSIFKAQAALAWYYEGTALFTATFGGAEANLRLNPVAEAPDVYGPYIKVLAERFAAAFLDGGDFTVGVMGDSTAAGTDNCYYDNWVATLERQMKPFFAAAKVNFTTRNAGHNGGHKSFPQLHCLRGILGDDVDIAIAHFPFVKPEKFDASYELFVRRALASGILPHTTSVLPAHVQAYSPLGATFGPAGFTTATAPQQTWWPDLGRAHWGRVGDGLCHTEQTRSGSVSVAYRNWHPGPAGHQVMADKIAFTYLTAAAQGLTMIEEGLKASGGKVGPLKDKYRGRDKVKEAVTRWPQTPITCSTDCKGHTKASRFAACASLCEGKGDDRDFPWCVTSLGPWYGLQFPEYYVADQSPKPCSTKAACTSAVAPGGKPYSAPKSWLLYNGSWSGVGKWEVGRPGKACVHVDRAMQIRLGPGALVIRVPKGTMKRGTISGCIQCAAAGFGEQVKSANDLSPTVQVQVGSGKVEPKTLTRGSDQETFNFMSDLCWSIAGRLPVDKDILVHIDCTGPAQKASSRYYQRDNISGVLNYFAAV
eukprot:CAMPEP_0206293258 /NCGR_PEP_ID=MMETSP0106_2-20121207/4046_1 /ASSEMBLY_ACC=CAM_ASM_000206 /TAXON_ID=81532 /ORGANISM="Acanthoeca-like sp., Strain 10tr" /LENGTH=802 /DNA_ID=CAMNT_0053723851 /DNA_START=153 /DNA_END=2561 /DNA_ORIENTATION=+